MEEFAEFLGWMIVVCSGFAAANWAVKAVHRRWITRLPREREHLAVHYRRLMKLVVGYHRWAGGLALAGVAVHGPLMTISKEFSPTGALAAACLAGGVGLGVWGAYVKKQPRGGWLKIHMTLAVALVVAIVLHLTL